MIIYYRETKSKDILMQMEEGRPLVNTDQHPSTATFIFYASEEILCDLRAAVTYFMVRVLVPFLLPVPVLVFALN